MWSLLINKQWIRTIWPKISSNYKNKSFSIQKFDENYEICRHVIVLICIIMFEDKSNKKIDKVNLSELYSTSGPPGAGGLRTNYARERGSKREREWWRE